MIVKIEGIFNSENKCCGTIEILSRNQLTVYASWKLDDEDGQLIAGKSRSYFIENIQDLNDGDLFKMIIDSIHKYRLNRKRVFESISIL